MPQLNHTIGDNKTFEIPLRLEGRNFTPGSEWNLIWTLFSDPDDPEGSILRQKETDVGIVHSGNDALVSLVPQDTQGDAEEDPPIAAIAAGTYYWATLAVKIADGTRRHVADGSYVLKAASTSLSTPSVPIYMSTPPSPNNAAWQINNAAEKTTPVDADLFGITDSAAGSILKRLTWVNIKATLKTYFDALYASISHTHAQLHDPTTVSGNGISISGQQISLSIGTGSTQVAAGDDSRLVAVTNASFGGEGVADSGKLIKFSADGSLSASKTFTIKDASGGSNTGVFTNDGTLSAKRTYTLPNKSGTLAMTSDVTTFSGELAGSLDSNLQFAVFDPGDGDQPTKVEWSTILASSGTFTNKTISVDSNTISGIAASSFVLSNASGNLDGSAAQKVIPSGVVVGTTDTQTLTNKTLTSPVLTTPALGTPASGTLTNCTGLPIAGVTNGVGSVTAGVTGADAITNIMSLTQAEYDAIGSKNASTLYVIV